MSPKSPSQKSSRWYQTKVTRFLARCHMKWLDQLHALNIFIFIHGAMILTASCIIVNM